MFAVVQNDQLLAILDVFDKRLDYWPADFFLDSQHRRQRLRH